MTSPGAAANASSSFNPLVALSYYRAAWRGKFIHALRPVTSVSGEAHTKTAGTILGTAPFGFKGADFTGADRIHHRHIAGLPGHTPRGFVLFQAITVPYPFVATGFLCTLIFYYLVWKHLVGFFNELLGIT